MPRFLRWTITLSIAGLGGLLVALVAVPRMIEARMLEAVGSPDPAERQQAWTWWAEPRHDGSPRASIQVQALSNTIASTTSAEVLLDGSAALRRMQLWSWAHQPTDLIVRETTERLATGDAGDASLALETLANTPAWVTSADFLRCANLLLRAQQPTIQRAALEDAITWLAAHDPVSLSALQCDHAPHLKRTLILACAFVPEAIVPPVGDENDLDLIEAAMFASVVRSPDDTRAAIARLANLTADPPPATASILRHGRDEHSWRELERLANAGDVSARFAQHARSRDREHQRARDTFVNAEADRSQRMLAAWRMRSVDHHELIKLLDQAPADPTEPVYADVLVAERHLARADADALAERWIRSFSDRRKRAGALLAMLLGVHHHLLAEAHRVEDVPVVRTIQYLALHAMGRPPEAADTDPAAVAHRVGSLPSGDFDPDVVLARLAAGDDAMLRYLTSPPLAGASIANAVQQRAWLVQRFVPDWHTTLGRPIGGSMRSVRLHFEALDALRLVTRHCLGFDESTRTFRSSRR